LLGHADVFAPGVHGEAHRFDRLVGRLAVQGFAVADRIPDREPDRFVHLPEQNAQGLELLERQGFVTVIAGIALPNDASIALHERLGFRLSGIERGVGFKLGEWVDVGRWQKDLACRAPAPTEPCQFRSIGALE
jgi:hypothetical protein